uniref:Cathepsin W n=1 Tax=Homo sapiens TaxID=9606 RepID=A0A7P0TAB1_HUMAN
MALTAHPSCLLALLVAGLAQGIRGPLRAQSMLTAWTSLPTTWPRLRGCRRRTWAQLSLG